MQHPDQVISREQLLQEVWGYDYDPGTNIVDVYIGLYWLSPQKIRNLRDQDC